MILKCMECGTRLKLEEDEVTPCPVCTEAYYDEGYDHGYSEGYVHGKEEETDD